MANRGKNFERELKASMEDEGMFVMRIADKVYWNGTRIASEQTPADFLAYVSKDRLIALMVECKATAQKSLPFDNLQEHQHKSLHDFESFHDDAKGYVAVNFYDADNLRNRNRCFMVPIRVWDEYVGKGDRKSLSMDSCVDDERIVECRRVKGSIYDVYGWIETL